MYIVIPSFTFHIKSVKSIRYNTLIQFRGLYIVYLTNRTKSTNLNYVIIFDKSCKVQNVIYPSSHEMPKHCHILVIPLTRWVCALCTFLIGKVIPKFHRHVVQLTWCVTCTVAMLWNALIITVCIFFLQKYNFCYT